MKILFKVTSRSRPENLLRTLHNITGFTSNPDYLICLSLDEDDKTVNNPEFRSILGSNFGLELHTFWGLSKNKIDAINRDVDKMQVWDILVNVSDDQVFTFSGFDELIRAQFKMTFPDLDGFLHYRDSNHNPPDALATMSIIGRKYFNRDGYIYHPDFKSFFCDNLAQDLAKVRGCYHFIDRIIFNHLHPSYGKAPSDQQYKKNDLLWKHDEMLYNRMKRQIHKYL
jgi:hypothetical protein